MSATLPSGFSIVEDEDVIPLPDSQNALPPGFALVPEDPQGPRATLPVTFYSLSKNVGGSDEAHDTWTDKGFSAKGQNLTPGIAAVNPKVIPHGSVLRDVASGHVFLASDSHGNEDSSVVDLYVPPEAYSQQKTEREFELVGKVDEVPTTAEGVREVLAKFGTVPQGDSAAQSLERLTGNGGGESAAGNEFRRTNGAWEQRSPDQIDWTAPARVVDEQVPRAQAVDHSQLPDGFSLVDEADPSQLPEGFTLEADRGFVDLASDVVNQFSRGATSDGGIFSMTEGVSRLMANLVRPKEMASFGASPDEIAAKRNELQGRLAQLPEGPRGARMDAEDIEGQLAELDLAAVSDDAQGIIVRGEDGQYHADWAKALANGLSDTLSTYADDVSGTRGDIRQALPVTEEFQKSLAGGIVAGFGQLPAAMATYAIPGFGPLAAAGGVYDEAYQDALSKGADVATAHRAGMIAVPSGALDVLSDKFVIGKILKPLKGKITVGQLAKTFAATGVMGGSTEGLQQGWLNFSAKYLAGYDPNRKLDDDVVNSIIIGGLVDSTVSAAGAGMVNTLPGKSEGPAGKPVAVQPATQSEKPQGLGGVKVVVPGELPEGFTLMEDPEPVNVEVDLSDPAPPSAENVSDEVGKAIPVRKATTLNDARKEALSFAGNPVTNADDGLTATVSGNTIGKMLNDSSVGKSVSPEIHALAVANVDQLFENGIRGFSGPDEHGDNNISSVHRYFAPMLVGNDIYVAKMTVKEFVRASEGSRIYSLESIEMVKPARNWVASISETRRNYTPQAGFREKLVAKLEAVNAHRVDGRSELNGGKIPPASSDRAPMAKPTGSPEGGFVSADIPQAIVDFGKSIYRAGMDFAQWSGRMLKEMGESVRKHLENLWKAIVAHHSFLPKAGQRGGIGSPTDNFGKGSKDPELESAIDEAAKNPEKRRKFIQSVKNAEDVLPSVKDRVDSFYAPVSNKETVEAAKGWINEKGLDSSLASLLSVSAPTDRDYAAGIEMISRLQGAERFEDAAALVERMAERSTDQGRAIQALSLLAKLSSEGIEIYAHRQVQAAVKKSPKLERLYGEITRLKDELRKARIVMAARSVTTASASAQESVQARIHRLMVENPGSLWGRYKQGAVAELARKLIGPDRPRLKPPLENFTARLKRNLLDQLPEGELKQAAKRGEPVDEAAMIGEAVRNFDKYREVWEDAQRHVQALYRDNPEALESLDDYFGQILERPFSEKSLDRAVKQVMQEMNTSMKQVLVQGSRDKAKSRLRLASLIVERAGLSNQEAERLATAVWNNFEKQQKAAREALLKQMTALRDDRVKRSVLEKLIEQNNAGALDDQRFFGALARQYGLPVWTPELSAKVQRLQREHEAASNPELKLVKAAQMLDAVHEMIPADVFTKVRASQNLAMLLNPKTMIRNIFGNVALFAADVSADSVSRWVVDPAVGIVTGKRTRRSVDVAARLSGLAQPVRDFWNGYDFAKDQGATKAASAAEGVKTVLTLAKLASRGKYELADINRGDAHVFSSLAGRLLENTLGVALSIPDRAFHQASFKGSLIRQMRLAEARGESLAAPTPEMVQEAMMDAARAVFQDENFVSKALLSISKGLNLATTFGKSDRYGMGAVILPFSQVPGSIAVRGAEWTPIGLIRTMYEVMRPVFGGEFRQKDAVDSFSRAMLGSGIAAAGLYLLQLGIISALGEEDKDLDAMREASGFGKFRINFSALKRAMMTGNWWTKQSAQPGDVTVNYDWMQPLAMPLAMGAEVAHQRDLQRINAASGKSSDVPPMLRDLAAGGAAAMKSLEDQPLMMGISRLGRDMGQHGAITGVAMQALDAPGMFVPTALSQINQLFDNQVRETRAGGPMDQAVNRLFSRIPGLSEKYPQKVDVFGESQLRYDYGGNSFVNVLLNPTFMRQVKSNPALKEASAIYAATGENGVLPKRAPVKLQAAGQSVELTNEQISQYQQLAGSMTVRAYGMLAASPRFAQAPMGAKAVVMDKVISSIHNAVKIQVLSGNPDLVQEIRTLNQQKQQAQRDLMTGP
ncbi:MAG: hypothetical protein ACOYM3_07200 [Terrimicrobiaceae bacterium]